MKEEGLVIWIAWKNIIFHHDFVPNIGFKKYHEKYICFLIETTGWYVDSGCGWVVTVQEKLKINSLHMKGTSEACSKLKTTS